MISKAQLPTDSISIVAIAFGAAVIVPSLIALIVTLVAVVGQHF